MAAKKVELNIVIDEDGLIHIEPNGTEGTECLDLMAFLDKLEGFEVIETVKNKDFKTKTVQLNSLQKINR